MAYWFAYWFNEFIEAFGHLGLALEGLSGADEWRAR